MISLSSFEDTINPLKNFWHFKNTAHHLLAIRTKIEEQMKF